MGKGKVYLVGAGPGDPKLITLKGLECIQIADVIVYDRLASPLLLSYAKSGAEQIYCGKLPHNHTLRQEAINELLVEKALQGKVVTRLKGGDPCVFGRVGEEAAALVAHGISFEIVPGVTSGIAAPAYAGIPVTHRDYGSTFAMVTGHLGPEKEDKEEKWKSLAMGIDTIVFYMGMSNLSKICDKLMTYGKNPNTPVAIISWGTTPDQVVVTGTLADIEQRVKEHEEVQNPAIVLVGEVVKLRDLIQGGML
jgi:uroporphyrin-III C-methyltransferase